MKALRFGVAALIGLSSLASTAFADGMPSEWEKEISCNQMKRGYRKLSLGRDKVRELAERNGRDADEIVRKLDQAKREILEGLTERSCGIDANIEYSAQSVSLTVDDPRSLRRLAACPDGFFATEAMRDALDILHRADPIFFGNRVQAIGLAREALRASQEFARDCGCETGS